MFSKKTKCKKCGEKISEKHSFCPNCGTPTNNTKTEEDYGLLGKTDSQNPFEAFEKGLMGGISGKMLNRMINGAMKMMQNEMRKNMQNTNQPTNTPKPNFELYINGKKISPKNIKVTRREIPIKTKRIQKQTKHKTHTNYHFDEETQKKYSKMDKTEPHANVRRLSNQVIYEIEIPGVISIKNVAVIKLENSIEIRAITKNKAYKKIIPVDLPLKRYKLEKETLILELGVKE